MAISTNERRAMFFDVYKNVELKSQTRYTEFFKEAGNEYFANTEIIVLKDMFDQWVYAGIVKEGSSLPTIKDADGVNVLTVKPDSIGAKAPFNAHELNFMSSSTALETEEIESKLLEVQERKMRILKAAYTNTLEVAAAAVLLEGVWEDNDLGLNAVASETIAADASKSLWIAEKVQEFEAEQGYAPKVLAGKDLISALLSEVNGNAGNPNQTSPSLVLNGKDRAGAYQFLVNGFPIEVEKMPIARKEDGSKIDTAAMFSLHAPETLGVAYAGINVLDSNNVPINVVGEAVIDKGIGDKETGLNYLWIKGAPLPVVINVDLVERYAITLS